MQQEFVFTEEQMSCPFLPNRKDLNSSQNNSLGNSNVVQEKRNLDKQATRRRIGSAFRNSWGRRELDHKAYKKKNSLVNELSSALNSLLANIIHFAVACLQYSSQSSL